MSQEEGVLIDIEKQTMEEEQHDLEMQTQKSRRSISGAKVFSPTNADNLANKLPLTRSKSTCQHPLQLLEDEEGSGEQKHLKYSKSLEAAELINQILCTIIK